MKQLFLLVLLFINACGRNNSHTVKPLPITLQKQINASLINMNLPSPADVDSGIISYDDQCLEFQKKLPSDWTSGSILVPENPDDANGRKISVFYYGKIVPNSIPTVFFNGGPGASSWSSFRFFFKNKIKMDPSDKVSLIYIDQRGNGCSSYYPQGDDSETLERLRYYGSRGIVADAEAVRKHLLGDKKWVAFGQSYGAFINHRYAIMAPDSLKASFSHANAITQDAYQRSLARIRAQDRVLKTYLERYPEDRKKIEVFNNLTTNDCYYSEDKKDSACGYGIVSEIVFFLNWTSEWPELHSWLEKMVTEDHLNPEGATKFLAAFYFSTNNPLNSRRFASKVISWVDRDTVPFDSNTCNFIAEKLELEGIDVRKNSLTECAETLQWNDSSYDTLQGVKYLKRDLMTVQMLKESLIAHPKLPFYLYSGNLDAYVPVESFTDEVSSLEGVPNFIYKNFPDSGHNGYEMEPELWSTLIHEVEIK